MVSPKNVYHMLAYVFNVLNEESFSNVGTRSLQGVGDLFAQILSKGIQKQLSKGLDRCYEKQTEELTELRGSINVNESIRKFSMFQKKLVCDFDEYTYNSYMNQILKTTMIALTATDQVSHESRKLLERQLAYLDKVDTLHTSDIHWGKLIYTRSNQSYKMLMNVCYLVDTGLMRSADNKLMQFMQDAKMRQLFGRFVSEWISTYAINGTKVLCEGTQTENDGRVIQWLGEPIQIIGLIGETTTTVYGACWMSNNPADRKMRIEDRVQKEIQKFNSSLQGLLETGELGIPQAHFDTRKVKARLLIAHTENTELVPANARCQTIRIEVSLLSLQGTWSNVERTLRKMIISDFRGEIQMHPQK